jgi:hypothetical protein
LTCNSEFYTYYGGANENNTNGQGGSSKICIDNFLLKLPNNITNCKIEIRLRCILCNDGYYLNYLGNCVSSCGDGYFISEGLCVNYMSIEDYMNDKHNTNMSNCKIPVLSSVGASSMIDSSFIGSSIYNLYTSNGH